MPLAKDLLGNKEAFDQYVNNGENCDQDLFDLRDALSAARAEVESLSAELDRLSPLEGLDAKLAEHDEDYKRLRRMEAAAHEWVGHPGDHVAIAILSGLGPDGKPVKVP